MSENVLQVKNLQTIYSTSEGVVKAVDGVSFSLNKGETLAIVGESGSGKSQTAFSILQLIPQPQGKIINGEVLYKGKDLLKCKEKDMQTIRGNEISIIFQEPMTSLNPVQTIGKQISESLILHQKLDKKQAKKETIKLLKKVGMPYAEKRYNDYPHQMSGGMRQRAMIAIALACNPSVLIADEPTTALDVTIQAQILSELSKLKKELKMSIMLITHDLGVVAEMADRVVVMYCGQVVEISDVFELFDNPKHPYTIGLMNSMPTLDSSSCVLPVINGSVPDPLNQPTGCKFHPRCKFATEKCKLESPSLTIMNSKSSCSCHYPQNI